MTLRGEDDERPVVAWLDVSAGVAGDMLLGAFVDAGAAIDRVQAAVDAVIPQTVRLRFREVTRHWMRGLKVDVELLVDDQPHRRWTDIRERIEVASLDELTRRRSLAVFQRLAEAEGRVHGVDPEQVHFHEVGAWDAVADVVGTCAATVELGIDDFVSGPIALGSGSVRAAHGLMPVPVPAVLELCKGWDVASDGVGELATPTGVALVTALTSQQQALPRMRVRAVGVGAGTKEQPDRPNMVRVVLGSIDPPSPGIAALAADEHLGEVAPMSVLEANVDDLDPRLWPTVIDGLLAEGAADAWITPITMKRGRPAQLLSVLCAPADVAALRDAVFAMTSTIGVRVTDVARWALARGWVDVTVSGQQVAVKIAHRNGRIFNVAAEFRDVEAAARALGRPVREVLEAAQASAAAAGWARDVPVPELLRPAP